ncbi:MAG: APC family permease, partial [Pseudomonadota bacterium]
MQSTASLKRVLGRLDALFLGFGAMIGWGWIILSGVAVEEAGVGGATLAFVLGSAVILVIGFAYAELASALPFAGGEHAYTQRAFGGAVSFVATWSIIFGYVSVVAFEAIALPVAVAYLVPEFKLWPLWEVAGYRVHGSEAALGAATAFVITILNILGVRLAVRVQTAALVLIFIAGGALILGGAVNIAAPKETLQMWNGASGLMAAIIIVPFLFVGFDVIPQSAEEIDTPRRDIGRALIGSIAMAIV